MKNFYKEKTPIALNNILIDRNVNPKSIPNLINFLERIAAWNFEDKGPSSIFSGGIKERFGKEYKKYINILEQSGLVIINHSYYHHPIDKSISWNKTYTVPNNVLSILSDSKQAYVMKRLKQQKNRLYNPMLQEKLAYIQNTTSAKNSNIPTEDVMINRIDSTIKNSIIDRKKLKNVLKKYPLSKCFHNLYLLVSIIEGTYNIKRNESDGRISNPLTNISKEVKEVITVSGKSLCCILDIRACHPSLFAQYIKSIFTEVDFEGEVEKYNAIFLSKERNPRIYLAQALKIKKDRIKDISIKYFNGIDFWNNKDYIKYDIWMKDCFPIMYRHWKSTDISRTGCNISKYFETVLILNQNIYSYADTLGLELVYENDGFGLYGDYRKVDSFLQYLIIESKNKTGVELVFTNKYLSSDDKVSKEEMLVQQNPVRTENTKQMKNINTTVFRKVGNKLVSYLKISDKKNNAVTFENPLPVIKENNPDKDYVPSEKKVAVRTTAQILASAELKVSNAEYNKDNLGTQSPEQQIERLRIKTESMIRSNKAESAINNPAYTSTANEANTKYAITDTSINVSENQWYKILHPSTEEQYHISFQKGKCFIVTHLSNIKMLVLSQASLMGLYGTSIETHMPKSRFDSIVTNGPTVKTLSTIYRIVDIQRNTDIPANEDFWKNPVPVYNVTN